MINQLAIKFINAEPTTLSQSQLATIYADIERLAQGLDISVVDRDVSIDEVKVALQMHQPIPVSSFGNDNAVIDATHNIQLRAIHDVHHVQSELSTSVSEEIRLATMFESLGECSDLFKAFYRSEVAYQAAFWHYTGNFMSEQKLVLTNLF